MTLDDALEFILGPEEGLSESRITAQKLRILLDYHTYNYILKALAVNREYQTALRSASAMLTYLGAHLDQFERDELACFTRRLFHLLLTSLDKLDLWEDYLRVYDRISDRIDISFMAHRRKVVGRKLEKKRAGKQLGNLMHKKVGTRDHDEMEARLEALSIGYRLGVPSVFL